MSITVFLRNNYHIPYSFFFFWTLTALRQNDAHVQRAPSSQREIQISYFHHQNLTKTSNKRLGLIFEKGDAVIKSHTEIRWLQRTGWLSATLTEENIWRKSFACKEGRLPYSFCRLTPERFLKSESIWPLGWPGGFASWDTASHLVARQAGLSDPAEVRNTRKQARIQWCSKVFLICKTAVLFLAAAPYALLL